MPPERSLTEAIDTTTPGGRLVFHVFGAVAQFERALAVERSAAGVAAARAAGRIPGPARAPTSTVEAIKSLDKGGTPRADIATGPDGVPVEMAYFTHTGKRSGLSARPHARDCIPKLPLSG